MELAEWRRHAKKTQEEVASDLRTTRETVWRWEHDRACPDWDKVAAIKEYTSGLVGPEDWEAAQDRRREASRKAARKKARRKPANAVACAPRVAARRAGR